MSLETYWLVVAPGLLLGLSAIGWAWLWMTREVHPPETRIVAAQGSASGSASVQTTGTVRRGEATTATTEGKAAAR